MNLLQRQGEIMSFLCLQGEVMELLCCQGEVMELLCRSGVVMELFSKTFWQRNCCQLNIRENFFFLVYLLKLRQEMSTCFQQLTFRSRVHMSLTFRLWSERQMFLQQKIMSVALSVQHEIKWFSSKESRVLFF